MYYLTMKLLESLKEYFKNTPQDKLDSDWEEVKYLNEIGPDVDTENKLIVYNMINIISPIDLINSEIEKNEVLVNIVKEVNNVLKNMDKYEIESPILYICLEKPLTKRELKLLSLYFSKFNWKFNILVSNQVKDGNITYKIFLTDIKPIYF